MAWRLKVIYQGLTNSRILVRLGLDPVVLSVDGTARVGGPVWIKIELPFGFGEIRYPMGTAPSDFGCNQMEVRQNGVLLPRIAVRLGPVMTRGNPCGTVGIGIPDRPQLTGRLPLHLQYRFEKPGSYRVRYTLTRGGLRGESRSRRSVALQSAWTSIEVSPAQARARQAPPTDPAEIPWKRLSAEIPGIFRCR